MKVSDMMSGKMPSAHDAQIETQFEGGWSIGKWRACTSQHHKAPQGKQVKPGRAPTPAVLLANQAGFLLSLTAQRPNLGYGRAFKPKK